MTLTINYTGPTMALMAPAVLDPLPATLQLPPATSIYPVWDQRDRRLTATMQMPPVALDPLPAELPPPGGGLVFQTFPPAYKEKSARRGWQIYPNGRNR